MVRRDDICSSLPSWREVRSGVRSTIIADRQQYEHCTVLCQKCRSLAPIPRDDKKINHLLNDPTDQRYGI